MAISGKQVINIGLPNESIGSDSLYTAFNKSKDNFTQLFACASPYNTFTGNGLTITSNANVGTVNIDTTVQDIQSGPGILVESTNGVYTITNTGSGNGGGAVTSVGLTSSTLAVNNSPITSAGSMIVNLQALNPPPSGVFNNPTMTVDQYGRIVTISSGTAGTVTSVALTPGAGIQVSTSGNANINPGFTITNTGVTRLSAGTGISLSGSNGAVTVSTSTTGGTVTGVTVTSNALVVTGSPITTSGTITVDLPNNISVTGNVSATNLSGNGGNITYQQTNTFYVDPGRTQNYTPSGSQIQPFFTITAAISAAVTAGYNDTNPAFIILMENITENVTLKPGIFLTSLGTGTHGSPNITGTITITSSTGTTVTNHYSISNLRIVAPTNGHCILFTGTAPQKLFVRDMWLDANGTGDCIYMDNTGSGSTLQMDIGHLAHSGTGDVYCIDLTKGNAYLTDIETSGNVQVAAVRSGTVMTIDSSEIDANNNAAIEVYGGTLTVTNSIITNTKANSNGVALNTTGSICTLLNVLFSIPTGTGKAVFGTTTSLLYYLNVAFAPGSNTGKTASPALIATVLGTTWS